MFLIYCCQSTFSDFDTSACNPLVPEATKADWATFTLPAITFTNPGSPQHLSELSKNKCEYIKWSRSHSALRAHSPRTKVQSVGESQRLECHGSLCDDVYISFRERGPPRTLVPVPVHIKTTSVRAELECYSQLAQVGLLILLKMLCFCLCCALNIYTNLLSTTADQTFRIQQLYLGCWE